MLGSLTQIVQNNFRTTLMVLIIAISFPWIQKYYFPDKNSSIESEPKTVKKELKPDSYFENERIFTADELKKFDGTEGKEIFIAIMGQVYDVSKGVKHYGVGGSYHFFAGRDASVSFISGNFETISDELDHVLSLGSKEILSLKQWKEFYDKDYIYKGKLIGRFYDKDGKATEYSKIVDEQAQKAIEEKALHLKMQEEFPGCNIEWNLETGTRVWCTANSGGKNRDYVGVPRKYFEGADLPFRCACVKDEQLSSPKLKEYDDCDPKSISCNYKIDE